MSSASLPAGTPAYRRLMTVLFIGVFMSALDTAILAPGAVLYFVAHHQRLVPELGGLRVRACEEITAETVPEDFRNKTVHRCWRLLV